jgi:hypothetical protein
MSIVTAAEFKVLLQGSDIIQDVEVIEPVVIQSADVVNSSINLRRCDIASLTIRDKTNITHFGISMTRLGTFSLINCTIDQLQITGSPSSFDEIKLVSISLSKLLISEVSESNTLLIRKAIIEEIEIDGSVIRNTTIRTRANTGCDLFVQSSQQNEFKISGSYGHIQLTQSSIYNLLFEKVRSEEINLSDLNIALFAGDIRFSTDSLHLNNIKIGLPYVTPF